MIKFTFDNLQLFAHKKGVGSSKNGRDSQSKRLGVKRADGQFVLAGNILGKTRTVSVAIASETAAGNYGMAGFWVVVILIISFVIVAAINIVSGKGMKMGRWM